MDERLCRLRPMRIPINQIIRKEKSYHSTKIKQYTFRTKEDEKESIQENKIQQEINEIIYFHPMSDWVYDDDLRIKQEVERIMKE